MFASSEESRTFLELREAVIADKDLHSVFAKVADGPMAKDSKSLKLAANYLLHWRFQFKESSFRF